MIGALVPATLLPRFISFVGDGTYATAPMDIEPFEGGTATFWRGPLVGGAVSNAFAAYLEESHDAQVWTSVAGWLTVDQPDDVDDYTLLFKKRWLRVRIVLDADPDGLVAISTWMTVSLRRRVPPGA